MKKQNIAVVSPKEITVNPQQWLTPTTNIEQYIAKVRQIPILSSDEEFELAEDLQNNQSIEAAQKLILHHLKFVVYIARGFTGYGLPLGDLIQEGNVGLMKAVKKFEPQRGIRLVSFAVHWIKSEINEYVIKNWRLVKIATTKSQRKLFFNLRQLKKSTHWLNDNEAHSIAEELNVAVKDVYEMEKRLHGQDVGFDPLDNSDDEHDYSPSVWLTDNNDPSDFSEKTEHDNLLHVQLAAGINQLDKRSRDIIQERWLNENSKITLQMLAEKYHVSAERIRQIEQQAFRQLKTDFLLDHKNS